MWMWTRKLGQTKGFHNIDNIHRFLECHRIYKGVMMMMTTRTRIGCQCLRRLLGNSVILVVVVVVVIVVRGKIVVVIMSRQGQWIWSVVKTRQMIALVSYSCYSCCCYRWCDCGCWYKGCAEKKVRLTTQS